MFDLTGRKALVTGATGGLGQAIARALHFGARVLVIDEPTAPITVARQTLFGQAILAARARGLAVVVVTNSPQYAHLVGDRFLLLGGGRVAGDLTREDVDVDDQTGA